MHKLPHTNANQNSHARLRNESEENKETEETEETEETPSPVAIAKKTNTTTPHHLLYVFVRVSPLTTRLQIATKKTKHAYYHIMHKLSHTIANQDSHTRFRK